METIWLADFLDPAMWRWGPAPLWLLAFLLTIVGLPAAALHGAVAWGVSRVSGGRWRGRALLLPGVVALGVMALSWLTLVVGGCDSLAALAIDNIDHRFRCTRVPDALADALYAAAAVAGLSSFGWPWFVAGWLMRRPAQTALSRAGTRR